MAVIRWCEGVWFLMSNGELGALHAVPRHSRSGVALCSELPKGARTGATFDTADPAACGHCVRLALR